MITARQWQQFLTATTAWARWSVQHGRPYRHPHAQWSRVGSRYVYLQDAQGGLLARYDRKTERIQV